MSNFRRHLQHTEYPIRYSAFLAVRYASEAMEKTNPSRGKDLSGGSIILTSSVAGLRSGAGTVDCKSSLTPRASLAYSLPL